MFFAPPWWPPLRYSCWPLPWCQKSPNSKPLYRQQQQRKIKPHWGIFLAFLPFVLSRNPRPPTHLHLSYKLSRVVVGQAKMKANELTYFSGPRRGVVLGGGGTFSTGQSSLGALTPSTENDSYPPTPPRTGQSSWWSCCLAAQGSTNFIFN